MTKRNNWEDKWEINKELQEWKLSSEDEKEIKSFVSTLLQEQREEIIEKFEKLTDNFPKLIKDTRKTLMENQTKFGARFGLAHNTISYIEQGEFESPWSIISFCQKYQLKSLKEKK